MATSSARHAAGGPQAGRSVERLAQIGEMEGTHFWFTARRTLVERELRRHLTGERRRVLDLGCGTGSMLEVISQTGHIALGADLRPDALAQSQAAAHGQLLAAANGEQLPIRSESLDAVLLLDVLEHVDDASVLAEVRRVLRPGALVLITVPAYRWLWSPCDDASGHLRRYTKREMRRLLHAHGFHPVELSHYQFLLFPLFAVSRLLRRGTERARAVEERPLPMLNRLLAAVNRTEVRLGSKIRWPWGSSVVAVARRAP